MDVHSFSETVCFASMIYIVTCGTNQEVKNVCAVAINMVFYCPLCSIEGGEGGALLQRSYRVLEHLKSPGTLGGSDCGEEEKAAFVSCR